MTYELEIEKKALKAWTEIKNKIITKQMALQVYGLTEEILQSYKTKWEDLTEGLF